jgi:tubulin-specific chaperone D
LKPLFLQGLEDFTNDQRGDVGSWVRAVSITGIGRCLEKVISEGKELDQESLDLIIGSLLKAFLEKIDNLRVLARDIVRVVIDVGKKKANIIGVNLLENIVP